ncbi:Quinate/shikimate dehydrogenase [Candidatus Xiphinematobacter sp. Idaho Grape]|uniref:shikimate dehydrogenase n=1 Tax=Candidatus Xiphinematobacter sp. Idaho Grape TaxID=1704307 RepID=UPI000705A67D|nr:shikimate dehydrogenase [Candidatus Xiphinematobacter sp. Idaho Grape]ALJ56832.1 Quinate/shikimate dehydrogenase [Candidatus Xiphinematobacter sp. Idaho Grape]
MTTIAPRKFSATDLIYNPEKFKEFSPPAKIAVFGDPVSHSRSPEMHNPALLESGIEAQYVRIHVRADELPASLRALANARWIGANLTIPHKAAAAKLVDHMDRLALLSGAVNTVVVRNDGSLSGYNTDGPGLVQAVREKFRVDIKDLTILILGACGGAGRAIAAQCALGGCERLVLANRSFEKIESLKRQLQPYFRNRPLFGSMERLVAIKLDECALSSELPRTDLLINATSVGMEKNSDFQLVPRLLLTPRLMVLDSVYTGGKKTQLLLDAEANGARVTDGLSMLLHQGALSFEIWFNRPAPLAIMRKGLISPATA